MEFQLEVRTKIRNLSYADDTVITSNHKSLTYLHKWYIKKVRISAWRQKKTQKRPHEIRKENVKSAGKFVYRVGKFDFSDIIIENVLHENRNNEKVIISNPTISTNSNFH